MPAELWGRIYSEIGFGGTLIHHDFLYALFKAVLLIPISVIKLAFWGLSVLFAGNSSSGLMTDFAAIYGAVGLPSIAAPTDIKYPMALSASNGKCNQSQR